MFTSLSKLFSNNRTRSRTRSATPTYRPQLEALEERSLMNASPAAASALTGVVQLQVTYADHQTAMGTGAMIDSSHVLTAAHLLYSAKDGGYATSIEAFPLTANSMGKPASAAFGTYERVDPSWFSFNSSYAGDTSPTVEDIGLVTLNRPLGNSIGSFGLGYNNNNGFFHNATFNTVGYSPGTANSGPTLHIESGKALGTVSSDGIDFTQSSLAALPGQSGSPIYQVSAKGTPVIYGVLTGADGDSSSSKVYAARITPAVYNELQSWEKTDKAPAGTANATSASQVTLHHPAVTSSPGKVTLSNTPTIHALDDNGYYNLDGQYIYTGPQFVPYYPTNPEPSDYNNPFVQGIGAGYYGAYQFYNYYTDPWSTLWDYLTYEPEAW
jgi:V8-like Glu-specific endopeptidase